MCRGTGGGRVWVRSGLTYTVGRSKRVILIFSSVVGSTLTLGEKNPLGGGKAKKERVVSCHIRNSPQGKIDEY